MKFDPTEDTGWHDDCVGRCMAYIFDMSVFEVPRIPPNKYKSEEFWDLWEEWITQQGGVYWWYNGEDQIIDPTLKYSHISTLMRTQWMIWIAIVPSFFGTNKSHAVLMKGNKLLWDCSFEKPRKRKPKKIYAGLHIEKLK